MDNLYQTVNINNPITIDMNSDFRFYSRWALHNEISMNEGDANSRERMQQEMELHLHQQYAENNNANLGSVITLIVAL